MAEVGAGEDAISMAEAAKLAADATDGTEEAAAAVTAAAGVEAFWEVILDENATCHIALGSALPMGYTDPADPGVNRRGRHFDVVIGTPDMRVTAETPGGDLVVLDSGRWASKLLPG